MARMRLPSDVRKAIWVSASLTSHLAKSPPHASSAAIRERPFSHDTFGVLESPIQKPLLSWASLDCVTTVYLLTLSKDALPRIMLSWLHRASG